MDRRAFIVVDLGFGDAGKGLVTDWLARTTNAKWVVRFNGGAQAGHNVVTPDGRHHTFAQFGAASFLPEVRTFLSRHVVVHPGALFVEADALANRGVSNPLSRIWISAGARVITPFQQAANRLRELARGPERHGSCGIGFGETVEDSLLHPEETLFASDLSDASTLRRKLSSVLERKRAEMVALWGSAAPQDVATRGEWAALERRDVTNEFVALVRHLSSLGIVVGDEAFAHAVHDGKGDSVVFEGAQGVLLDEDHGFHPHTTWSHCTARNALALCEDLLPTTTPVKVGVLRSHMVRHGNGPLPSETSELHGQVQDYNASNTWQGEVRYGWFDAVLARYALDANGGVDALVLTHADLAARLGAEMKLCTAYRAGDDDLAAADGLIATDGSGAVRSLVANTGPSSLEHQERLTRLLSKVTPVLQAAPATNRVYADEIEQALGRSVDVTSKGPRANDVTTGLSVRSANVLGHPLLLGRITDA